jgi:hypothetical protein
MPPTASAFGQVLTGSGNVEFESISKSTTALLFLLVAQVIEREHIPSARNRDRPCVSLWCQPWFARDNKHRGEVDGFYWFYTESKPDREIAENNVGEIHEDILHFLSAYCRAPESVIRQLYCERRQLKQDEDRRRLGPPPPLTRERRQAWAPLLDHIKDAGSYVASLRDIVEDKLWASISSLSTQQRMLDLSNPRAPYSIVRALAPVHAVTLHYKMLLQLCNRGPKFANGKSLRPSEFITLFYYQPMNDGDLYSSPVQRDGTVANWFAEHIRHGKIGPDDPYAAQGGDTPELGVAPAVNYDLPAPFDRFSTVAYTESHLRPLEDAFLRTGLPHMLQTIQCEGPEWEKFVHQREAEARLAADAGGYEYAGINMERVSESYRRSMLRRLQTESVANFLQFLRSIKEQTRLKDYGSRLAAQRALVKIWVPNNTIGESARAVATWMHMQVQANSSENFAGPAGRFEDDCGKCEAPQVVGSMLSSFVLGAEFGLKMGNLHCLLLVSMLQANACCIIDDGRTQPGVIFTGPPAKGKSYLTRCMMKLSIPGSFRAISYSSKLADTCAANDFAFRIIIDDAGPRQLGMKTAAERSLWQVFQAARIGPAVEESEECGRLKQQRTTMYQTTEQLFAENGKREKRAYKSVKSGFLAIMSNINPVHMDPALKTRFLTRLVLKQKRSDFGDQVGSRIDALDETDDTSAPRAIEQEMQRRERCIEAILNIWALLAECNGMAKPDTRWANWWIDAFTTTLQEATGLDLRNVRQVDLQLQLVYVLAQYRAIAGEVSVVFCLLCLLISVIGGTGWNIGLCQRPDAADPFSPAHFDGLSHAAVADLDCCVPVIDLASVFIDPVLFVTCYLIRMWDEEYRTEHPSEHDGGRRTVSVICSAFVCFQTH